MKSYFFTIVFICSLGLASRGHAQITGSTLITLGATTSLHDSTVTGMTATWVSSNPNIARISSPTLTTAQVTGISGGSAMISHAVSGGTGWDTVRVTVINFNTKWYFDRNGNCVKDATEPFLSVPALVQVKKSGVIIDTISVTSGLYYTTYGAPGTIYEFRLIPDGALYVSCPASGVIYDTVGSAASFQPKLVALSCTSSTTIPDLVITAVVPVTGIHDQWGNIYIHNRTCAPAGAAITMYFSPKYAGIPEASPVATISGHSITWDVTGMSATAKAPVDLYYVGWSGSTYLTVGDTVHEDFSVISPGTQTIIRVDTVRAGCDPNFIETLPEACFQNDTTFLHTIHFENTGNDTAHDIYILDTLDNALDASTLRIVESSAEMYVSKFQGAGHTIFKFDFPHINLLDSSHHGLCDGAVFYSIKNSALMATGQTINSRAGIYFDINPVVMTNTANNVKGCPTTMVAQPNAGSDVDIYPNPTVNELVISSPTTAYTVCTITNSIGQTLLQQQMTGLLTKVNVALLPPGLYSVMLKSDRGNIVKKFAKE